MRRGRGARRANPGIYGCRGAPARAKSRFSTMLVHTVYFWLKPELTAAQRADFRKGVESLGGIKAVDQLLVGTPAKTVKRPIIDDSYSFALTVIVKDIAAHDAYQIDPIHLAFVEGFKTYWSKVQIYDAD